MDWRTGSEWGWIPLVVFFNLFVIFILIGLFGGHKRALYWFGGLLGFYCIGWMLNAFLGTAFANWLASLKFVKELFGEISQEQIGIVILPFTSLIMVAISLVVGTLVLLICYYSFAKRLMLLNKVKAKSRANITIKRPMVIHSRRYNVLSKFFGGVAGLFLMAPIVNSLTETAYAFTMTYDKTRENKINSIVYDYVNWTDYALSYGYVHDITRTVDGVVSLIDFVKATDAAGEKLLPTFFKELAKPYAALLNLNLSNINNVPKADLDNLKAAFAEYDEYIKNNGKLINQHLNNVCVDKKIRECFQKLCESYINELGIPTQNKVTFSSFDNLFNFTKAMVNGSRIDLREVNETTTGAWSFNDYDLKLQPYTKLSLTNEAYDLLSSILASNTFEKSTWKSSNEYKADYESIMNVFFESDAQKENKITGFENLKLLTNWDQMLASDDFIDKEGYVFAASPSDKNELLSANGSMEHPYIIPEKLFWDCDGQTSPTPYVNPYITDLLNWTFVPNYTPINATAKISWDEQLSAQLTGTGIVLSESGVKEGTMSLAIDSQAPSVEQLKTGFDFSCKIKYVDEISTRENEESIYFKISPVGYSWRNN